MKENRTAKELEEENFYLQNVEDLSHQDDL